MNFNILTNMIESNIILAKLVTNIINILLSI
jgi:hypothetical protein